VFFPQLGGGRADTSHMLTPLVDELTSLLFRPACAACDELLAPGEQALCSTCRISVCELGAACPRCAEPLGTSVSLVCQRCCNTTPAFDTIVSPYRYGGQLAEALRRLKFHNRSDIARTLAPLIGPMLRAAADACDLVMPMPLHKRRQRERGYNQSALLLRYARPTPPVDCLSLRRPRATAPQSGLSATARRRNMARAFVVPPRRRRHVAGRTVLIVDDVVTTGATMDAAAAALHAAGAAAVVGFCAARAEF